MTVTTEVVIAMFTFIFAVIVVGARHTSRRAPTRVVKSLITRGGPYEVRIDRLTSLWVPGRTDPHDTVTGPGTGVYRLDDAGDIHLAWTPQRGDAVEFRGPVPDNLRPDSPQMRRARRVVRVALCALLVVLSCGFAIGAAVGGGTTSHRVSSGFIGVIVAMFASPMLLHFAAAIKSVRMKPPA